MRYLLAFTLSLLLVACEEPAQVEEASTDYAADIQFVGLRAAIADVDGMDDMTALVDEAEALVARGDNDAAGERIAEIAETIVVMEPAADSLQLDMRLAVFEQIYALDTVLGIAGGVVENKNSCCRPTGTPQNPTGRCESYSGTKTCYAVPSKNACVGQLCP